MKRYRLTIKATVLDAIQLHGEEAYPEEGAGFLLGSVGTDGERQVTAYYPIPNRREDGARHNRYLIGPQDTMRAEDEAVRLGLDVIGVFHSHPDHPSQPSIYDRDWAMPWYSYIITSIDDRKATRSQSWRLRDDRSGFDEEEIQIAQAIKELR